LNAKIREANPPNLMQGAEPIFIDGGETGIIFFHGFTASPYEGKDFAAHFAQKGYTVWAPLLPGHGTHPVDLVKTTWEDWYSYAENCFLELKQSCKKIILAGQSMGGSLALSLASRYSIDAVITLAAAVFLKDWRLKLLPVAKKLLNYQYKSRGPDISLQEVKKNNASYHKYPISSIEEFLKLLEHTKQNLKLVKAPLLLFHSKKDHTVTYKNMNYILNHVSSKIKEKITLQNSYHIISLDQEKTKVFKVIEDFIKTLELTI
jgi:carboxylesterase